MPSTGQMPPAPHPPAAAAETPCFTLVQGTPVYGVLHEAEPRPHGLVLVSVPALGVEQITLYRQDVMAARAAAVRGIPVLRYHARGHGDSGGAAADVTCASLVEDARAMADEARRRTGARRVVWLGARLGALIAALAGGPGSGRDDTAGFLFWEPAAQPANFFREQLRMMLFSRVAGGERPEETVDQLLARLARQGGVDVLGYMLYHALVESFAGVSLEPALAGVRVPVRIAQVQKRAGLAPGHARLAEALERQGTDVQVAKVAEEPGYQIMANPAWTSDELTRVTMGWLDALA